MPIRKPLLLSALLLASLSAAAAPPFISTCQVFDKKNFWNTPIDGLPVHASSTNWVNSIGANTFTHPDFGTFDQGFPIGIPFITVPGNQQRVTINFDPAAADESDPGPYPIPPNAPVEGGGQPGDQHVLVLERDNCVLYELYLSTKNPDNSWNAYSGAIWDFKVNANRPQTFTSADAAGLPILPGLLRYDEFIRGDIQHAIRFTANSTQNAFVWPATHQAGSANTLLPPMGARFRLKASFNTATFNPQIQNVLNAMKKYGIVLADNGSSWYFSGEHNPSWDDTLLNQLKTLRGSDFEAVDTSAMKISNASTKAFTPPPPVTMRQVATGLAAPLDIQNAADGSNRLFIVEKGGTIRILKNGALNGTPFFSIAVDQSGERGLLGLAFDPNFKNNRRFFVFYTPPASNGLLRVSSFSASVGNPDIADMTERIIIDIPHPTNDNHNGGKVAFGPDGYLYISTGDGGSGGDPPNNAQNLNVLLGKLLRLDVSAGGPGYAIPPTNPYFGGTSPRPEIWAYGLRNPFRFSFDRHTGDLFIGDVGQDTTEEVDYQPAGTPGGRNYGWRVLEGPNCFNPPSGCTPPANYVPPILSYGRTIGNVITGGHMARGRKSRSLYGQYIFADEGSSRIFSASRDGNAWSMFNVQTTTIPNTTSVSGPAAFGEDEAGELYVASINNGRIFAVEGPGPGVPERVTDLNGNGNDDLVWQNTDGRVAVWLMSGITPTNTSEILPGGTGWSPAHLADLNGDGMTDIVWQNVDGRVAVWLMNGTTPSATAQIMNAGAGWSVKGTGDLNADGKADLVWQHTDGRVAVWLMNGTVPLATQEILPAGSGFLVTRVADFDADGKRDILFSHPDGRVAIWLMNGTAVKETAQILNAGGGWSVTHTPDLNGDGRADIIFQNVDGTIAAWIMNGTTMVSGAGLLGAGSGWSVTRTGDFDGDGKTDIFWLHTDGRAAIWLMNGITPTTQTQILNAGGGWSARRVTDVNGDGKADIVWHNTDGRVAIWLMNGTTMTSGAGILGTGTGWGVTPVSQ